MLFFENCVDGFVFFGFCSCCVCVFVFVFFFGLFSFFFYKFVMQNVFVSGLLF